MTIWLYMLCNQAKQYLYKPLFVKFFSLGRWLGVIPSFIIVFLYSQCLFIFCFTFARDVEFKSFWLMQPSFKFYPTCNPLKGTTEFQWSSSWPNLSWIYFIQSYIVVILYHCLNLRFVYLKNHFKSLLPTIWMVMWLFDAKILKAQEHTACKVFAWIQV